MVYYLRPKIAIFAATSVKFNEIRNLPRFITQRTGRNIYGNGPFYSRLCNMGRNH